MGRFAALLSLNAQSEHVYVQDASFEIHVIKKTKQT